MENKTLIELKTEIQNKKISSYELTKFFLDRIKKIDSKLNSFITITENNALKKAKEIDSEITKGNIKPL